MSTEITPGTYTVKFTGPRLSPKRFKDALALVKGADGSYDATTKTWTVTVKKPRHPRAALRCLRQRRSQGHIRHR